MEWEDRPESTNVEDRRPRRPAPEIPPPPPEGRPAAEPSLAPGLLLMVHALSVWVDALPVDGEGDFKARDYAALYLRMACDSLKLYAAARGLEGDST